jgi:hypothetical protein
MESMGNSKTQTMQIPFTSKTKTIVLGSKKENGQHESKGKTEVEELGLDRGRETKTKLREIKEKVDYNEIDDSEENWED